MCAILLSDDQTRVLLKGPSGDYINANYVNVSIRSKVRKTKHTVDIIRRKIFILYGFLL